MREHKQERGGDVEAAEEEDQGSRNQMAVARDVAEVKKHLARKGGEAAQAVVTGCNIFQMAVRGMGEEKLQEKLTPDVAESLKDKVIDKLWDKFKDGVTEAADLGKDIVSHSSAVFSAVKGQISDRIKAQKELTLLEVADSIVAGMMDKSELLHLAIAKAVSSIPPRKLLVIRQELRRLHGASDEADSKENGYIADGLKDWFLSDVIGMPRTDTVASEEYAVSAFAEFQMGVVSTMPAHEAGDAIQKRLENPDGDREAVEHAEGKMGKQFNNKLSHDRNMRARTEVES